MEPNTRFIYQLKGESDWPIQKNKVRDVLYYHTGALATVDGSFVAPKEPLSDADKEEGKKFDSEKVFYRKAINYYAMYTLLSSLSRAIYRKVMDKATA